MGKESKVKKSNLLYQRLQESLEQGTKVWVETEDRSFAGIPIHLNREFVEILVLGPTSNEEDNGYERTTWLIRLSSISAIAYQTQYWSKKQFEKLFSEEAIASQPED